jgi:hypothetical protein
MRADPVGLSWETQWLKSQFSTRFRAARSPKAVANRRTRSGLPAQP